MPTIGNGGTAASQENSSNSTKKGETQHQASAHHNVRTDLAMLNRYLLAVVSNQGGISLRPDPKTVKSDQKRLADFKGKVSAVLSQLDLPVTVYAATGRDEYRKPRVGMWRELLDDHDLDVVKSVDLRNSFFVGDAGGREAVAGISVKDHSCVDRYAAACEQCIAAREHLVLKVPGILQPTSAYHSIRRRNSFCSRHLCHS